MADSVRKPVTKVFWEMFAGQAGLTMSFFLLGWSVGLPVDVGAIPEYNLLNPLFLGVVIGLILEEG